MNRRNSQKIATNEPHLELANKSKSNPPPPHNNDVPVTKIASENITNPPPPPSNICDGNIIIIR